MKVLAYHITWGTYGTRLHGDPRGTVDRTHNEYKSPILKFDEHRWEEEKSKLKYPPVRFDLDKRITVESMIPDICARGFWNFHTCAAGKDHVHVILNSPNNPETIRQLLKRWLGQEFTKKYQLTNLGTWWAECGSIRWINDEAYLRAATKYITEQRATPESR
jgi:hypothetical protein